MLFALEPSNRSPPFFYCRIITHQYTDFWSYLDFHKVRDVPGFRSAGHICYKLPSTFALFAVLSPNYAHSLSTPFYCWCHSRESYILAFMRCVWAPSLTEAQWYNTSRTSNMWRNNFLFLQWTVTYVDRVNSVTLKVCSKTVVLVHMATVKTKKFYSISFSCYRLYESGIWWSNHSLIMDCMRVEFDDYGIQSMYDIRVVVNSSVCEQTLVWSCHVSSSPVT